MGYLPRNIFLAPKIGPASAQGVYCFNLVYFGVSTLGSQLECTMAHEALISFKLLLQKMENDLGLSELSDVETKVFLAISDLCNQAEDAKTQAVLQHDLVTSFGRATVFRALKKLESHNKIIKTNKRHGTYSLCHSETQGIAN